MSVTRVLAIDTVTEMCSVALYVEGETLERREMAGSRHSNIVLGMVTDLLDEAGLSLQQLELIINDVGPGSFTGIRIGLGVAQGLAYGADLPLLGVDSLTALAQGITDAECDYLLPAIDARMNQVYWALFRKASTLEAIDGLHLGDPGHVTGLQEPVYGCGSGWDAYAEVMRARVKIAGCAPDRFPLAADLLQQGLQQPESQWVGAGDLLPVYLRNNVAKVSSKPPLTERP